MSGNNLPIDSKCLEILDAALRRSTSLTQFVPDEELLPKIQSGSNDLMQLLESLRDPPPAAVWINDPSLSKYLPFVLRWQDTSTDDPGRAGSLQRVLTGNTHDRQGSWSPWIYPSVVLLAALLVAILLGTTIIPMFKKIFVEFELNLPAATKLLIWLSDGILLHPIELVGAVFVLVVLFIAVRIGMRWIDDRLSSGFTTASPFYGSRRQVMGMARWTGSLAEMLRLGMPVSQAIALAGKLSGRHALLMQSLRLAEESRNGPSQRVAGTGKSNRPLGLSPVAMAALQCPDSDKRVALLRGISDLYWNRLLSRSRINAGWIAPTTIVLVGSIVAFVLIALLMPLLSLVTSLSG